MNKKAFGRSGTFAQPPLRGGRLQFNLPSLRGLALKRNFALSSRPAGLLKDREITTPYFGRGLPRGPGVAETGVRKINVVELA